MYRLLPSLVMCFIVLVAVGMLSRILSPAENPLVVQGVKCKSQNSTGSSVGSTFAFFLEVTEVTSGVGSGCALGAMVATTPVTMKLIVAVSQTHSQGT
jgi:hypothetical protein